MTEWLGDRGRSLGREEIDAVQRGDDLTTDEELFQRLAALQLFFAEQALPKSKRVVSFAVAGEVGR
jgi:hypothetical protein